MKFHGLTSANDDGVIDVPSGNTLPTSHSEGNLFVTTSGTPALHFSDGTSWRAVPPTQSDSVITSGTTAYSKMDVDYTPSGSSTAVVISHRAQVNYSGTSSIASGGWLTASQHVLNIGNAGTIDKLVGSMSQLNVAGSTGTITSALGYEAVVSTIPAGRVIQAYAGYYFPNLSGVPNIGNITSVAAFANDYPAAVVRSAGPFLNAAGAELTPSYHIGLIAGRYYSTPSSALSTAAMVANVAYVIPVFVPHRTTITKLGVEVTNARISTSIRLGLYRVRGVGLPPVLVVDGGVVSSNSTGVKEVTVSVTVDSGSYFIAAVSNGTPSIRHHAIQAHHTMMYGSDSPSAVNGVAYYPYAYGTLPSVLPSAPTIAGQNAEPHLWFRIGV